MNPLLLVPLAASIVCGLLATAIQRRLPPRHAVQVLTAVLIVCALTVLWALLLLVLGWVAQLEVVADSLGWCDALLADAHGSAALGVAATVGLAGALVGAAGVAPGVPAVVTCGSGAPGPPPVAAALTSPP